MLVLEFDSGHGTEELRRFKSQDSSGKFTFVKLLWYHIYSKNKGLVRGPPSGPTLCLPAYA